MLLFSDWKTRVRLGKSISIPMSFFADIIAHQMGAKRKWKVNKHAGNRLH